MSFLRNLFWGETGVLEDLCIEASKFRDLETKRKEQLEIEQKVVDERNDWKMMTKVMKEVKKNHEKTCCVSIEDYPSMRVRKILFEKGYSIRDRDIREVEQFGWLTTICWK